MVIERKGAAKFHVSSETLSLVALQRERKQLSTRPAPTRFQLPTNRDKFMAKTNSRKLKLNFCRTMRP